MSDSVKKYYEDIETYPKKPIVTKYGYDTPLNSRVRTKTASDNRVEPTVVDGGNFNKLLIEENTKLKEEIKYLTEVLEELRQSIISTDELEND